MRFILLVLLFSFFVASGSAQKNKVNAKTTLETPSSQIQKKAVFVAYNWLYSLEAPTSPRQFFVADVPVESKEKSDLVKLMYFPKPSSVNGGVEYLKIKPDFYLKGVNISIRPPSPEESDQCKHFVNFLDSGSKNKEPQMMFHSFRYDSFMTFNFDEMKCFVLVSVSTKLE